MKMLVILFSFASFASWGQTPYDCKPLYVNGKEAEFVECLRNLCAGAETEAQIRACASSQQNAIVDQTFVETLNTKFAQYETKPQKCNSHNDCAATPGLGCYKSDPTDIITDEEYDFVQVVGLFTNKNPSSKRAGEACTRDAECPSMSCAGPSGSSVKYCLEDAMFCRKAQFGEQTLANIQCDVLNGEQLTKDGQGKCRTRSYMEGRSRQLVKLNLNKANANICNPNDEYIQQQFETLKTMNYHARAFESLFADSQTEDAFKTHSQFRSLAREFRGKRMELVKKLNKSNAEFKAEFVKLNTLKANSQKEITFMGKKYKEADLYAKSIENGLALDLMTKLEDYRSEYNKSLGNLYLQYADKFPPFIEDFYGIDANGKKLKTFGNQEWGRCCFKLKNRKQWNYSVKIGSKTPEYLKEIAEGKAYQAMGEIYPAYEMLLTRDSLFKDFPFQFNTKPTRDIVNNGRGSRWFTRAKRFGWFPNRAKRSRKNFFKELGESFAKANADRFSKEELSSWDDLIDPELRFYSGCYNSNQTVPEEEKKTYCGPSEELMAGLQSYMLAHTVVFSGTGREKHYPKNYFDGDKSGSNQSNSPWIRYDMEGPRGNYFRFMYEAFFYLGEAYLELSDSKDQRLACINKSRVGPNGEGLFYSQYHQYNPANYVENKEYNAPNGNSGTTPEELAETGSGSGSKIVSSEGGSGSIGSGSFGSGSGASNNSSSSDATNKKIPDQKANTREIEVSSYTKSFNILSGDQPGNDFDWDGGGYQNVSRSGSSLTVEEEKHVMKNLNNYEAPAPAQDTIFETISNSYVDNAYPAIFSE